MTTIHRSEDVADDSNQMALEELARAIEWNVGEFALILARCNSATLQDLLVQRLRELSSVEIWEIVLDKSVKTLFTTIQTQLGQEQVQALMVRGLESAIAIDELLPAANNVREEFRKNFQFPLVLWVTDEVMQKLRRVAPDLESWTTTVEFEVATDELIHFIQQTADEVFTKVLDAGADRFLNKAAFNLGIGSSLCAELESARHELQRRGVKLNPQLEACLEFLLGRGTGSSPEECRQHYERSLALWQQSPNPKQQGFLLYCLGSWWHTYAVRHRAEHKQACERAKSYFKQCIEVFEQANYPDLVAKFINALGDVLQRLQDWDELETVAKKALALHQSYPDPYRRARAYGFLAEVGLAKSAWTEAQESAQQALSMLISTQHPASQAISADEQRANLDWECSFHQGWYLFSLARAQQGFGQSTEAIKSIETAIAQTKPQYDPELYIGMLEKLGALYFEQGEYLKAFDIKQEQQSIEQQYGFRAFIGAGRLQPKKQVASLALADVEPQGSVPQEIIASGRQQDVHRLVERIGRPDHKLTVIHGQSGVGKSSIVQAGLIPALTEKPIGTHDVLPVLQQSYTDWSGELGRRLAEVLVETHNFASESADSNSTAAILEQLRKNTDRNLLTVLIFDQFEEFFFVCKEQKQRRHFYEFLNDCLNIQSVKVIFSLREDYLHYLLECNNRLISFDVINNNILDKNILYHLGNFSPEDAKAVIQSLTEETQFFLERSMIDELVNDLARELGEVRPIELQVVGAQMQAEKITTLALYQEKGPKDILVGRFLEEVVKFCGAENEQFAKLVLYVLTDENNTRPLKTRTDLDLELEIKDETLDLILEIFVKSGLVIRVLAFPADLYQLVHDYLIYFVRKQQPESARLYAELEKERKQRKISEAKLNEVLQQKLLNAELTNLVLSSAQNQELDRVVSALKAGIKLKHSTEEIPEETQVGVVAELNRAVYGVRELNRLEDHTGSVTSLSFSPDGKLIASASEDKTVKLWRIDGTLLATLKGHTDSVTSVSFSSDGKLLASGSKDKTIKLWKLDSTLLATLEEHTGSVTSVSFSADSKLLASASEDKTIKLWNLDGTLIKTLKGHTGSATNVSFSPNYKLLASADKNDTVKLWDRYGREIGTINNYGTICLSFSSDSQTIILLNKDDSEKYYTLDGTLLKKTRNGLFSTNVKSISYERKLLASSHGYADKKVTLERTYRNSSFSIRELIGHNDSVTCLSFSSDGQLLASGSKDKTVKLWSINPSTFHFIGDYRGKVTRAMFSPDGKIIAATYENTVNLWSRNSILLRTLEGDGSILSFSSNSKTVVTSGADNIVKLWSLNGGEIKTLKGLSSSLSPDGKIVAIASRDNTVQLWESEGTPIRTLKGHTDRVTSICFSPDGQIIATIGGDNVVKLWRSDGTLVETLSGHSESVESLSFSPDSKMIATIGDDNVVKLWRSDGTIIKTLTGHPDKVESVSFSPDGSIIASVNRGENSEIKLWQNDGTLLRTIDNYRVKSMRFSPDSRIVASICEGNTVKLWSLDGTLLAKLKGHNDTVNEVSFSPDGETIATVSDDNTVKIWSKDGTVSKTLWGHSNRVRSVSFSPEGKTIATASDDKTVKIWSSDGKEIKTLQGHSDEVDRVTFSSDGQIITSVSLKYSRSGRYNYTVKLWSSDGKEIKTFQGQKSSRELDGISFSLDGRTVALASKDNALNLWSVDGTLLGTLKGHSECVNSVSFSPDGKTIATASDDKTVKFWNQDGTLLKTMEGHSDQVNSVSFSPDGKTIATASDDKTVKLWNQDGTLCKTFTESTDKVISVRFSPDGKTIATASNDKTIKLWSSNGILLRTLKVESYPFDSLCFSPDSKILAFADGNSGVRLHILNGTWFKETKLDGIGYVEDVSFSPDGRAIAAATGEGVVVLSLDLDDLIMHACNWAHGYLKNNPNVEESDRHLCDDIPPQK